LADTEGDVEWLSTIDGRIKFGPGTEQGTGLVDEKGDQNDSGERRGEDERMDRVGGRPMR